MCVQTLENSLQDPSFIADHCYHSGNHNPFLLFDCHLHSSLLDREMQVLQNAPPLMDSLSGAEIVDANNGLLCVVSDNASHSILLWNPAIREVIQVPKVVNLSEGYDFCAGFGFSPILNDYKIVRLCVSVIDELIHQVEVYSLSTGSWKEIEFGNLEGVFLTTNNGFNTNGPIFWLGAKFDMEKDDENDRYFIVSFDIALEVFALIPMRDVDFHYRGSFTVYEHKLAILFHTMIGNFKKCRSLIDSWVMEKDARALEERWSWTNKDTSSLYPCLLYLVTIWRNEIVCKADTNSIPRFFKETEGEVENDETKIVLCNLTINEFKAYAIPSCGSGHQILNYVESLVPAVAALKSLDPKS